jgi:lysophospholipase L1-like esterase
MTDKLKSLSKNLVLLFTSILVTSFLIEIFFKILGYGNVEIYEPDQKLFWKLKPNQDCFTKIGHKLVHINSKGTRGRDFSEKKPDDVFRIVSVGDSRTFGWGLSEPETYSFLLEDSLRAFFGDSRKVEVINAGVNAWSYDQIYMYLKGVALNYQPDLVIVAQANLWSQFNENATEDFRTKFMTRVWLKNLLRRSALYHYMIEVQLKTFYDRYRNDLIPMPEREDEIQFRQRKDENTVLRESIESICRLLKEKNVNFLLLHIPWEIEEFQIFRVEKAIKQDLSGKYDIHLIDLEGPFSSSKSKLFQEADRVHPNAEGNKIIANQIFRFLIKHEGEFLGGR